MNKAKQFLTPIGMSYKKHFPIGVKTATGLNKIVENGVMTQLSRREWGFRIKIGEIMSKAWKQIISFWLLLVLFSSFGWAGEDIQKWKEIESRYCEIFYLKDEDLKKIDRRVNISFIYLNLGGKIKIKTGDLSERVGEKFDTIFKKAEEILDMYPRGIKVRINVYKDLKQLNEVYYKIFKEKNKAISFYIYKTNTIYTTLKRFLKRC